MDCFKLELETLQYLRQQEQDFSTIIATISNLTILDDAVFQLYKCNMVDDGDLTIDSRSKEEEVIASNQDESGTAKEERSLRKNSEQENLEIKQKDRCYELFWVNIAKRGKSKQQKYMQLTDIAYYYFRLHPTCPSATQQQSLVEAQFQKYIKQLTESAGFATNIPALVKYCYRVQAINRCLWETKDLVEVRKLCLDFREMMVADLDVELQREKTRQLYVEDQLRKIEKQGSRRDSNKEKFQRHLKDDAHSCCSETLPQEEVRKILKRYSKIPKVQNYSQLFQWRINSCINMLNQILQKSPSTKQQLVLYLRQGRWIRQTFLKNNEKHEVSLLQEMVQTYSDIMKYSHKLKECKHYQMLAMELQITYRCLLKAMSRRGLNGDFLRKFQGLDIVQQGFVSSKTSLWANENSIKETKCINKETHTRRPRAILDKNHCNTGQLSNKNRRKMCDRKSTGINYQFICQQICQESLKKQQETYEGYLDEDPIKTAAQKFKELERQSKRQALFHRSLDYLTKRSEHTSSHNTKRYQLSLHQKNLLCGTEKKISGFSSRNQSGSNFESMSVRNAGNSAHSGSKTKQNFPFMMKGEEHRKRTREGVLIKRNSFKKEIVNLISITRRNIKPGRYFNQIKDAENNIYSSILSTQKRVTILTNQRLEEEIAYLHQVSQEKSTPIEEHILALTGMAQKSKGKKEGEAQQRYSFNLIGLNTSANFSIIQTLSSEALREQLELTMIQSFGREIGFIKIRQTKTVESRLNENQIWFTSYAGKIYNERLTIFDKSTENNKDHFITLKTCFDFEQLRKEVMTSEFYFELIQENLEKCIEGADVQAIYEYLSKSHQRQPEQSSNLQQSNEQRQQFLKKQHSLLIWLKRMSSSLLNWYYTKARKLNGSVLVRRQIPVVSDSLKFAIALDFMKKYTYKQCLEKLSNVRNKRALYECFRYLLYGGKVIVRGLLRRRNSFAFYCLSLESFSDRQFQIRTKQEGGSHFKDLKFTLSFYNMKSFVLISSHTYPIEQVLTSSEITLLALSNIIEQEIASRYMQALVKDIYQRQWTDFPTYSPEPQQSQVAHVREPNTEQKDTMLKVYNSARQQFVSKHIVNFVHVILAYVEIVAISVDLRVMAKYSRVLKIGTQYFYFEELELGCGIVLQVVKSVKKGMYQQINIYDMEDFKSFRYRHHQSNSEGRRHLETNWQVQSENSIYSLQNACRSKKKKAMRSPSFSKKYQIKVDHPEPSILGTSSQLIQTATHPSPIFPTQNRIYDWPITSPEYSIRKSPYHSRIVTASPEHPNRQLVNKIKKCTIQKYEIESLEVLKKKIIKFNHLHLYLCLSYVKVATAYRIDIYEPLHSRKFACIFRLQQFGFNQGNHDESKPQQINNINVNCPNRFSHEKQSLITVSQQKRSFSRKLHQKRNSPSRFYDQDSSPGQNLQNLSQQKHKHILDLFQGNQIIVSEDFRWMNISGLASCLKKTKLKDKFIKQQIKVPIFQCHQSLCNFEGRNRGKIQLIETNSRLVLLILLEDQENFLISVIEDNPFINNVNIFADFRVKEHTVTLYSDLFMRMSIKFTRGSLLMQELKQLKDIAMI